MSAQLINPHAEQRFTNHSVAISVFWHTFSVVLHRVANISSKINCLRFATLCRLIIFGNIQNRYGVVSECDAPTAKKYMCGDATREQK